MTFYMIVASLESHTKNSPGIPVNINTPRPRRGFFIP